MGGLNGTPTIGAATTLFFRPTVIGGHILVDDYIVRQNFRDIGRIRFAAERSCSLWVAIWVWHVTLPRSVPAWCNGSAASLDEAKVEFRDAWERYLPTLPVLTEIIATRP